MYFCVNEVVICPMGSQFRVKVRVKVRVMVEVGPGD